MEKEKIKVFLRPIAFAIRLFRAYLISRNPFLTSSQQPLGGFAFVVGCGRSGTTILGKILSSHPQIRYFFEPWHLWRAVDRRTDALQLFGEVDGHMLMGADMSNSKIQKRFRKLFFVRGAFLNIEKTPHNVMRIPYLESLCPNAKYIHIVRDGIEVATSIEKLATTNEYKLAGKRSFNQWWGESNSKWRALQSDGVKAGYFSDEAVGLTNDFEKGAYEWLVSLEEAEKHTAKLGGRMLIIKYDDLVNNPTETLKKITDFLGVINDQSWLEKSVRKIRKNDVITKKSGELPSLMSRRFNYFQNKFCFSGCAVEKGSTK